jgi:hypothetical protein
MDEFKRFLVFMHSAFIFVSYLCHHFIPELRGRSPVGNIKRLRSLQVVHRAEYWLPFEAASNARQPPVEHSHPDGVATILKLLIKHQRSNA